MFHVPQLSAEHNPLLFFLPSRRPGRCFSFSFLFIYFFSLCSIVFLRFLRVCVGTVAPGGLHASSCRKCVAMPLVFNVWVSLAAGFVLEFVAGTVYLFGSYAGSLRQEKRKGEGGKRKKKERERERERTSLSLLLLRLLLLSLLF